MRRLPHLLTPRSAQSLRGLFFALAALSNGCTPSLIGSNSNSLSQLLNTPITGLTYTYSVGAYVRNYAVPSNTPILATGAASSYSISAALPAGMSFDTSTGIISGTPTADTAAAATPDYTDYTITATNAVSTASVTVKLLVMDGYYVNNTAFTLDANTAVAACDIGDGSCTLRAAVQQANFSGGKRLIYLSDGTYTITSALTLGGTLTNLVLCGSSSTGTIVSASGAIRNFTISSSTISASFCNMTIQNGNDTSGNGGGGVYISNAAVTQAYEFRSVRFMNNSSTSYGGAIVFDSSSATAIVIDRSHFEGNTATGAAQGGGAILHNSGTLNATQTTFKSNTAPNGAGGSFLLFNTGTLNCDGCLFQSNSCNATAGGGAISVGNTSILNLKNSTFTSNTAGMGGAIDFAGTAVSTIAFSTFYANTAAINASSGGAIIQSTAANLTTTANIFEGNTSNGSDNHCFRNAGTWTSGGYNVFSSAGGTCATVAGTGDTSPASTGITTTLAYNDGEVMNHAITASSAAYNSVPLATCTSITTKDTRNFTRPSGSLCDSGAFEY